MHTMMYTLHRYSIPAMSICKVIMYYPQGCMEYYYYVI